MYPVECSGGGGGDDGVHNMSEFVDNYSKSGHGETMTSFEGDERSWYGFTAELLPYLDPCTGTLDEDRYLVLLKKIQRYRNDDDELLCPEDTDIDAWLLRGELKKKWRIGTASSKKMFYAKVESIKILFIELGELELTAPFDPAEHLSARSASLSRALTQAPTYQSQEKSFHIDHTLGRDGTNMPKYLSISPGGRYNSSYVLLIVKLLGWLGKSVGNKSMNRQNPDFPSGLELVMQHGFFLFQAMSDEEKMAHGGAHYNRMNYVTRFAKKSSSSSSSNVKKLSKKNQSMANSGLKGFLIMVKKKEAQERTVQARNNQLLERQDQRHKNCRAQNRMALRLNPDTEEPWEFTFNVDSTEKNHFFWLLHKFCQKLLNHALFDILKKRARGNSFSRNGGSLKKKSKISASSSSSSSSSSKKDLTSPGVVSRKAVASKIDKAKDKAVIDALNRFKPSAAEQEEAASKEKKLQEKDDEFNKQILNLLKDDTQRKPLFPIVSVFLQKHAPRLSEDKTNFLCSAFTEYTTPTMVAMAVSGRDDWVEFIHDLPPSSDDKVNPFTAGDSFIIKLLRTNLLLYRHQ
jgi:hypothetical protein